MATPPTFVAEYESAWNTTTTPKSTSVTVANGDKLVIIAVTEDSGNTLSTPTGGGLTYTLQRSSTAASSTALYLWTAEPAAGQTYTLSISKAMDIGGWWGFNCLRFSGSDGLGNSAISAVTTGAPTVNITTTQANSAIVTVNGDWNAIDGASRTARTNAGTFTEQTYFRDGSHYAAYGGFHADAGAVNTYAVGWSAPTGQKYVIAAIEIKGVAAAPTSYPPRSAYRARLPLLVR